MANERRLEEPRFDSAESRSGLVGASDFIPSADVVEHIAPPVERALEEASRLPNLRGFPGRNFTSWWTYGRRPRARPARSGKRTELRVARMHLGSEWRWPRLGRKVGVGPKWVWPMISVS
jgi:hypothetical protein